MRLKVGAATDVGQVRPINEDASQLAVTTIGACLKGEPATDDGEAGFQA